MVSQVDFMNLKSIIFTACLIGTLFIFAGDSEADDQPRSTRIESLQIGEKMPAFNLQDFRGKPYNSEEFKKHQALAVVFFGVECPLVKLYVPRLTELEKKFGNKFQVIGINSNRHDSITEIANFAKLTDANWPLLKDPANRVADAFGAARTPELFLFDQNQQLVYHGAIDDQYTYGKQKDQAENNYLADAVKAVLAGNQPKTQTTQSDGCIIGRILTEQKGSEVTYANQVSRILNHHCVSCHRPGEIAPFSLTQYDEVVGWAEMIVEVIGDQRMPPWHANPDHGKFKNDISLSAEQKKILNRWVENGAPLGDKSELPDPPDFVEGWQIGQPDVVISMRKKNQPYLVPAEGTIPYKYFEVETKFTEDKWVQAAEIRIGNRAVVHHVIVAIKDDDNDPRKWVHGEIDSQWITATAPGSPPLILPDGYAKVIPAGSTLVFQMHYTTNGIAQTDITSVGFKFIDKKQVKKVVGTRHAIKRKIRIPPRVSDHKLKAEYEFRQDSLVLKMFPHMHLRGKSFRYTAFFPDGDESILLDVPAYDFNWQNSYELEEPVLMPKGSKIVCDAVFDNSEDNFANPDPNITVRWGDQTWEEMMIGYFDMVLADQDLTREYSKSNQD